MSHTLRAAAKSLSADTDVPWCHHVSAGFTFAKQRHQGRVVDGPWLVLYGWRGMGASQSWQQGGRFHRECDQTDELQGNRRVRWY